MLERLSAYRVMWIFVMFDLPVEDKKERKAAAQFRKGLLKDGFTMMQYSIYIRHCGSKESANMHYNRIKSITPARGQVSILSVTDKQYGDIINIWGRKEKPMKPAPKQLEVF